MKFIRSEIYDVVLIDLQVFGDERGYFVETFRKDKLEAFLGKEVNFVQDNESRSALGVVRGLHYQLEPMAQSKLVHVVQGKIMDVAVDVRKGSATFGKHVSCILSSQNKRQVFIPHGFAHGFMVLENNTVISYKVDNFYSPEHERGILFNDKDLAIDWNHPGVDLLVSPKDQALSPLCDADLFEMGD